MRRYRKASDIYPHVLFLDGWALYSGAYSEVCLCLEQLGLH